MYPEAMNVYRGYRGDSAYETNAFDASPVEGLVALNFYPVERLIPSRETG